MHRYSAIVRVSVCVCLLLTIPSCLRAQTPAAKPAPAAPAFQPTPEMLAIQAASERDRQLMLDRLGIKSLRPPKDGDASSPNATNYDESKANPYPPPPDPLKFDNGSPVTSADQWWHGRRAQIAALFDREILGRTPAATPRVTWEVVKVTRGWNAHTPILTKQLLGHVDNSAYPSIKVDIELTLTTPANAQGPVPVVMELGWSREFLAMIAKMAPQFAASMTAGPTWEQQALARGWGYASLIPTSFQADSGAGLTQGIIGLINHGQPREPDDWGTLKAWTWGVGRALDYFETDKDVDPHQVALEGHSRYGKTTLVAMAYEPRLAAAFVSSSGEGGAKLYRHLFGEPIANVAAVSEYHWMAGNFLKYAGPLTAADLPVDNHELIALCAPRPVFISGGTTEGDGWADSRGMFLSAVGAGPVYRLLGKKGLGATAFPPIGTPLVSGDLAFRQHTEGHIATPNWPYFLDFASRYFHGPALSLPAPAHLTVAEDYARLLDQLGLSKADMRPPKAGDPYSPNATNYDESKATVYPTLPDPLTLKNGGKVTTADQWWQQRRPEILADYERVILGRAPANLPRVAWSVTESRSETLAGLPILFRRLRGHVDNSLYPQIEVNLDLLLLTPAKASGPVPVVLELAFSDEFLQSVKDILPGMLPGGPGNQGPSWQQQVLARGWAAAVLLPTSFQDDSGAGLTQGIIGLMNHGQPRDPDDWGTLRAWAWGASRALDYFESDPALDARQVALEGHSRFGKTALVAAAYDPRVRIVYSSSSGEGGAKLYRHIYGEQMENITSPALYQWFSPSFVRYGGPLTPADLPVDNHELLALIAPRPVFIGAGSNSGDGYAVKGGDGWADPRGMFLAELAAGPVYKLLGARDLGTAEFPPIGTAVVSGDLAFRQHTFGHTPAPNWPTFLDYASRYLHSPGQSK